MSPEPSRRPRDVACFPRVSGDEPATPCVAADATAFSPRERG